jgi:hypothetical protein
MFPCFPYFPYRLFRNILLLIASIALPCAVWADETCNSPYTAKLIKGQEDYVYVWTLGVEGLGDGSDKLVTVLRSENEPRKRYASVMAFATAGGPERPADYFGLRAIFAGGRKPITKSRAISPG